MKLLEGFRKLLGEAGKAVADGGIAGGVGRGVANQVNQMRMKAPQQIQQRVEQPIQARPMMNRMGENLSQEQLAQRQSMMNGQNAQRFVGRERPRYEDEGMVYGPRGPMPLNQIKPGESWMDPDRALRYAEAGGVSEDSAFGYTQDGIEPLTNVGPEKSWQPMYQLPNQEEYYNPFMRLMRKR